MAVSLLARGVLLPVAIVDRDEASYRAAAHALRAGATLYRDVADHHPPLAYAYCAWIEGALGLGTLGVRLVTLLLIVPLTALALAAFFGYDRRGHAAALLYVVWGAAFLGHDMLAVNCEVPLLLPACSRPADVIDTAGRPRLRFKRFPVQRYPRLARWLAGGYRPALELSGLVVWRRLDCQPAPGAQPLGPEDAPD